MRVSVILPARNEEANIEPMVRGLINAIGNHITEIIIVNDASEDRTAEVVRKLAREFNCVRLINRNGPPGVGLAIRDGLKKISNDSKWILTSDSDFVPTVNDMRLLIKQAETGCDGVRGSRFMKGGSLHGYPIWKWFINRGFHLLVRILLCIKEADLTNNMKLYRREIMMNIQWKSKGFAINAEMGLLPIVLGYKMCEVPVSWKARTAGRSSFNPMKCGYGYLRVIAMAFRIRHGHLK